jgi:hypothetical protein
MSETAKVFSAPGVSREEARELSMSPSISIAKILTFYERQRCSC